MIFNVPFIQNTFSRYNNLIFGGRLPRVPIRLTRAFGFVGKCVFPRYNAPADVRRAKGCSMRFSICFDMTEAELEDVVIHEMIHLFIYTQALPQEPSHGPTFLRLMEQINRRYGRHLTVKQQRKAEGAQGDGTQGDGTQGGAVQRMRRRRFCIVAVVYLTDGRIALKVLPRVRETIVRYVRLVSQSDKVSRVKVGYSEDPFFDNFPSSGALHYYVPATTDWVSLILDLHDWGA